MIDITSISFINLVYAIVIVIVSAVVAKVFLFAFQRTVLHFTSKTKTKLDDLIMRAIKKPIYIAIILGGIYFAIQYLNFLSAYATIINQGFAILWILIGAYAGARIVNAFFRWYSTDIAAKTKSKIDDTLMPIVSKIINAFIYVIALIIILKYFGIEITPLIAGLGIGGLAIALALQDSLANLFSGAFLASDKVVKVGDFVEIEGGLTGYVVEVGWRSTKIRTLPNNLVVVPNAKLANSTITNFTDPVEEVSIYVPVGVSYDSDLEKVEKVTLEEANKILKTVPGVKKDYKPIVRFKEFGDSNINFVVVMRAEKYVDQFLILHEIIKTLKKRYDKEGIEISFPVRKIVSPTKPRKKQRSKKK